MVVLYLFFSGTRFFIFNPFFFAQPLFESNFLGYLRIIIEKGFLEGEEVCLSWNLMK